MKLFTKSYRGDIEWLRMAFISVSKFSQEPVEWTLVVEWEDKVMFAELLAQFNTINFRIFSVESTWPEAMKIGNGYLRQQWIKLTAHRVMGNGLFWNWDSDVIAVRDFSSQNFIGKSGRPIFWFSAYNDLIEGAAKSDNANRHQDINAFQARRGLAQSIFNWPVSFEWMRCMPIAMFGEILSNGEKTDYWKKMFGMLISQAPGFSEFNFMGEYASHFFPDAFEWRNAETSGPTWSGGYVNHGDEIKFQEHAIVSQGFSWGGVPKSLEDFVGALK